MGEFNDKNYWFSISFFYSFTLFFWYLQTFKYFNIYQCFGDFFLLSPVINQFEKNIEFLFYPNLKFLIHLSKLVYLFKQYLKKKTSVFLTLLNKNNRFIMFL